MDDWGAPLATEQQLTSALQPGPGNVEDNGICVAPFRDVTKDGSEDSAILQHTWEMLVTKLEDLRSFTRQQLKLHNGLSSMQEEFITYQEDLLEKLDSQIVDLRHRHIVSWQQLGASVDAKVVNGVIAHPEENVDGALLERHQRHDIQVSALRYAKIDEHRQSLEAVPPPHPLDTSASPLPPSSLPTPLQVPSLPGGCEEPVLHQRKPARLTSNASRIVRAAPLSPDAHFDEQPYGLSLDTSTGSLPPSFAESASMNFTGGSRANNFKNYSRIRSQSTWAIGNVGSYTDLDDYGSWNNGNSKKMPSVRFSAETLGSTTIDTLDRQVSSAEDRASSPAPAMGSTMGSTMSSPPASPSHFSSARSLASLLGAKVGVRRVKSHDAVSTSRAGQVERTSSFEKKDSVRRYSVEERKQMITQLKLGHGRGSVIWNEVDRNASNASNASSVGAVVKQIVRNRSFDYLFGFVLMTNAILVGIEVDERATKGVPPTIFFQVSEWVYCIIFLFELVSRMYTDGVVSFFTGKEINWNIFDLTVVVVTTVGSVLSLFMGTDQAKMSNFSAVRVVRVARTVRVIRVIRMVKFFRALRLLLHAVFDTVKSCIWTIIVLVLIMYVVGIVFTITVTEYRIQMGFDGEVDVQMPLLTYWGTLPRSMCTLFMSFSGGIDWETVSSPLSDVSEFLVLLFVVYIAFVNLALMNVVTGLFCQNAIETAKHDKEEIISTHLQQKNKLVQELRELFGKLNNSQEESEGFITLADFEHHLNDKRMVAFYKALDIEVSDAWTLFKLLDSDKSGTVNIEQFVEGCLRLKGNAKAMQIAEVNYEVRWLMNKVVQLLKSNRSIETHLGVMGDHISSASSIDTRMLD